MTFAARDFSPRRGVSDEHIPQWICEERATKSGRKRPAALRVARNLACGFVARRLQPHGRGCVLLASRHRPNWAQRTPSYLCLRPLRVQAIARLEERTLTRGTFVPFSVPEFSRLRANSRSISACRPRPARTPRRGRRGRS